MTNDVITKPFSEMTVVEREQFENFKTREVIMEAFSGILSEVLKFPKKGKSA